MIYPIPKPRKRLKKKAYLKYVQVNPCLYCHGYGGNAHHVRWAGDCGMGSKPDDYLTIPLCLVHHDLAHNNPRLFAQTVGREEVFRFILKSILEFAENELWDMAEIYEILVDRFIEWIARERNNGQFTV